MRKRTVSTKDPIALCCVIFLALLPLFVGAIQQSAIAGERLTVAFYADTPITDPHKTRNLTSHGAMHHVCENLVTFDDQFEIIPQLAEKWSIENDGKTYIFTLRKGVKFHNGEELKAEDVKYSLERCKVVSPQKGDYAVIDVVNVKDLYTVEIKLKQTSPAFLASLAGPFGGYILPADLAEKQGGEINHPIGTGPFEWVEWQPDRFLKLKKFASYSVDTRFEGPTGLGGKRQAMVEELFFRIVPDRSTRATSLETGEIDFSTRLDVNDFDRLKGMKGIETVVVPSLEWTVLWLGVNVPPTNNLKFRKAIASAINYEEVAKVATKGYGIADPAFTHPAQKAWRTEKTGRPHKHDPEFAKKLLKEAGYDGEKIRIYSTRDIEYLGNAALVLQQQLKAVGINAEVQYLDTSGLVAAVYADEPKYEIGMMTSSGRFDADQHYFRRLHSSRSVNNYKNPEYDSIVEMAKGEMNHKERVALYDKAQEIIMKDIPCILLFHPSFFQAYRSYVKGYKMTPIGMVRFWNVWVEK